MSVMTIRIEVSGRLSADLAEWLEPLHCQESDGGVVLCGAVPDQAAVHALCNRLGDLGIPITSLTITKENRP